MWIEPAPPYEDDLHPREDARAEAGLAVEPQEEAGARQHAEGVHK
jgi:hypothetical protein